MIKEMMEHLDHVVEEMEAKWGVDRLPHLVSGDLRTRFLKQQAVLDEAIASGQAARTLAAAQAMERAWRTLDTVAMTDGQLPAMHRLWETTMPDGRVLMVGKDKRFYKSAARKADLFITLEEVARIVCEMPELVIKAKIAFPGSVITSIGEWDPAVGDELPF